MTTQLITRGAPPVLAARKPTGKPAWPMLLLAGGQKCGKTYTAAELSASDLVDRTFIIEVGEGMVDQYGAIPGARFEILEHDGTFMSIARQVWAATLVPRGESGKPHAIVLDSATEVWDLVSSEQQELANQRRDRRNSQSNRPSADGAEDAVITMDQWNSAKKRWRALVDLLRSHDGPVIWTARFEEVAEIGANGKPIEGQKKWKIRTEKNLPFEVDGIIEIPEPRMHYVTGIRSLRFQLDPGEKRRVPGFTIDAMLRALGLDEEVGQRHYVAPNSEAYLAEHEAEQAAQAAQAAQPGQATTGRQQQPAKRPRTYWVAQLEALTTYEDARKLYTLVDSVGQIAEVHDGKTLGDLIKEKGIRLQKEEKERATAVMTGKAPAPTGTPSVDAEHEARARARYEASAAFAQYAIDWADMTQEARDQFLDDVPINDANRPATQADREGDPKTITDGTVIAATLTAEETPGGPVTIVENPPTADTDGQGGEGHAEPIVENPPVVEPDPPASRRDTARRKGMLLGLREQFGSDEVVEAAAEQTFGLPTASVSTQRLADWLQQVIRENRVPVGASS